MNYPKCTLTDRELFDCSAPSDIKFEQVLPSAHKQIRIMVDRTIAHMIDKGELAVVESAPVPPAETPLTVEMLINILQHRDAYVVTRDNHSHLERVVDHKRLLNSLHDLRRS